MKRIFLTAISIALLLNLKSVAQIPNFGFEDWTSIATYEEPNSWKTSNALAAQAGISNVFKTTDKHGGTYAIKVTSTLSGIGYIVPGAACTGDIVLQGIFGVKFVGGFPYTNRADLFNGFMKCTPTGPDSAVLVAFLFKRTLAGRDTIAYSIKRYGAVASYTAFSQDFTYMSTQSPDSAMVILLSSKNLAAAQDGSELFVDDISFSGTVAGVTNLVNNSVSIAVYPNPSSETINFSISNISNAKTLSIYDILGKKVKAVEITSAQIAVSTEGLNNSLYFYQVADRNTAIISTGKFSVKK